MKIKYLALLFFLLLFFSKAFSCTCVKKDSTKDSLTKFSPNSNDTISIESLKTAQKYYDLIFSGKVIEINHIPDVAFSYSETSFPDTSKKSIVLDSISINKDTIYHYRSIIFFYQKVEIKIRHSFMGDIKNKIANNSIFIYSYQTGKGSCGFPFQKGETYFVFSQKEPILSKVVKGNEKKVETRRHGYRTSKCDPTFSFNKKSNNKMKNYFY